MRLLKPLALSILALTACVHAQNTTLSGPADWGTDDEIGAANRLSAALAKSATELVTTGKTYSLGMVINDDIPAYPPRKLSVTVLQPNQQNSLGDGPTHSSYNDDIFYGWLGIGSQIDGMGHVGREHVYYNNNAGADFAKPGGLTKLGVENIPEIVTRGVVLDMAGHLGKDIVDEGTAFSREDIIAAASKQNVVLKEGDVVLLHTGWLGLLENAETDPDRYGAGEPGLGKTPAEYLASIGVVAVGADSWGLEAVPFPADTGVFEVHQILLADNGIYVLENMRTQQLIDDGVSEFMFVLGTTKVEGAVQMMINPVAIR